MSEIYIEGGAAKIRTGNAQQQSNQCCREGRTAYSSYETAVLLVGADYLDITQEVVDYREERTRVAATCDFAQTGRCALEAAGMQGTFPSESEAN